MVKQIPENAIVINAESLVLGRMATFAAKNALNGKTVIIINSEKAIISGTKDQVNKVFQQKNERGDAFKGPFRPVRPDLFVKRAIRGMIPYKKPRGKEALSRITCYLGAPEGLKASEDIMKIVTGMASKPRLKGVFIRDLCKQLGWKKR